MPSHQKLDVLAVGAHPDDVEITCGGTLARLVQLGYDVGIVDLTDGEPTPRCPSPEVRRAEAESAASALGVSVRTILHFPNRRLFDGFEVRVALAREIRKHRPRVVIGFGDKTATASPDHWQAMQITDAGVFYARLTKWEEHFGELEPHTVEAQLYFTLAFHATPVTQNTGQFVMDIGTTLETKMQSIACYQSQFPPEKASFLERVRASARSIGLSAGFEAGEMFNTPKLLGTHDLMEMVLRKPQK